VSVRLAAIVLPSSFFRNFFYSFQNEARDEISLVPLILTPASSRNVFHDECRADLWGALPHGNGSALAHTARMSGKRAYRFCTTPFL